MFIFYANKNQLTVRKREPLTSGMVNTALARFEFSPEWEGLERTAVFRTVGESRGVLLDESGECAVPWEVLAAPGREVSAGVYGSRGGEIVLPTVWTSLGTILPGASLPEGGETCPPTPELWEQALAGKGDRVAYTPEGELGLYAGEKLLSSVPVQGGGGAAGVASFNGRTGAVKPQRGDYSPAMVGLEPITNTQLEAILK